MRSEEAVELFSEPRNDLPSVPLDTRVVHGGRNFVESQNTGNRHGKPILIDDGQKVSDMYNLQAMPTTVVVDRDGVVRYIHPGYKPGDEAKYVEVVKKLIRE